MNDTEGVTISNSQLQSNINNPRVSKNNIWDQSFFSELKTDEEGRKKKKEKDEEKEKVVVVVQDVSLIIIFSSQPSHKGGE